MTENLDLAQLRTKIQTAQSAPSAGLVMKLIQELEEARARHRKAWGRAEAAEAAVQRVREFLEYRKGNSAIAREALCALDGGEQE